MAHLEIFRWKHRAPRQAGRCRLLPDLRHLSSQQLRARKEWTREPLRTLYWSSSPASSVPCCWQVPILPMFSEASFKVSPYRQLLTSARQIRHVNALTLTRNVNSPPQDRSVRPTEVTYNALLNTGVKSRVEPQRLRDLLTEMREARLKPNNRTYTSLISGKFSNLVLF